MTFNPDSDIDLESESHYDCCGRSHLANFPDRNSLRYGWEIVAPFTPAMKKVLKRAVKLGLQEALAANVTGRHKKFGHVVEVTLTDSQAEIWEEYLLSFGFEKIMRFRNHKSGNHVNIYLNDIGRSVVRRKLR